MFLTVPARGILHADKHSSAVSWWPGMGGVIGVLQVSLGVVERHQTQGAFVQDGCAQDNLPQTQRHSRVGNSMFLNPLAAEENVRYIKLSSAGIKKDHGFMGCRNGDSVIMGSCLVCASAISRNKTSLFQLLLLLT